MKTYFRLLSFARPYSRFLPEYITVAFLSVLFGVLNFSLLIPLLDVIFGKESQAAPATAPAFRISTQYLVDLFYFRMGQFMETHGKEGALTFVCLIIMISVFLANAFRYWALRILARMRTRLIQTLRQTIYDRLLGLHSAFFFRHRKGDLLSTISNDVQEVENSVVTSIQVVFRDPVTIVAYFILLFSLSAPLTMLTLVLIPVGGLIIGTISRRLKQRSVQNQSILGRLLSIAEETISGVKIIRAFSAESLLRERFRKENDQARRLSKSIQNMKELAAPLTETIAIFIVAAVVIYGGTLVLRQQSGLTASEFIIYIIVYSQVLPPAKSISSALTNIQRGLAAGDRILRVVDAPAEVADVPGAQPITSFEHHIRFAGVSFGYEEKNRALDRIDTVIPKGKVIALVGPSGSGKTTLADLLPRFYDPTEGAILIDDRDIRQLRISDLRALMGIVTQEPILFNDTIYNNITLGMPGAGEEDVQHAARVANAHDFIMRFEKGYQTEIGDRGSKLSGGEKQRITIARAVLKNPPILILDEATSSLDTESERLVQEALFELMKNRTSLVIAHRLSTIQNADEILVLQRGRIEERGTHAELIRAGGLYKYLVELQML